MGDIAKNFDSVNFACPCCGLNEISLHLVDRLQELRDAFGKPMIVSSGYRCDTRNTGIGGDKFSVHCLGKAVDIKMVNFVDRFEFIRLAYRNFKRIGIYDKHIHLDIADPGTKPQGVMWVGVSK